VDLGKILNAENQKTSITSKDDDANRELKDTEQEVIIELKLKTSEFLKKLSEQSKKDRVQM